MKTDSQVLCGPLCFERPRSVVSGCNGKFSFPDVGHRFAILLLVALLVACGSEGGDVADNGGMSGTGISQGSVGAFGSIFVNGVEWDLSSTAVELDGVVGGELDLRLGMVVRVEGSFDASGLTGTADRVVFDDAVEGPIENDPVETIPGMERQFAVLGQSVFMNAQTTIFDDGASFVGLAADDVVEVSGFVDEMGAIQATRVQLKGQLSGNNAVELRGVVSNLTVNPDGSGLFDLGSILVRYTAMTTFTDVTRATLLVGDLVEIDGTLRVVGDEVDADEVELEEDGLGSADADRVEVEGIVSLCPQSMDFCVGSIPVDSSGAVFDPIGFTPLPGDSVEVEGPLVAGVIVADLVKSEEEDANQRNVRIEASVTSVDSGARSLVILGLTVVADGETRIEDKSSTDDENFMFGEILPGDYLRIEGIDLGGPEIRALRIERDDGAAGADDVRLEGPVTSLDTLTPAISILGQMIPLDAMTVYFDAIGQMRTEEEFFRNPGDIMIGDVARATDALAADLSVLAEADELEEN